MEHELFYSPGQYFLQSRHSSSLAERLQMCCLISSWRIVKLNGWRIHSLTQTPLILYFKPKNICELIQANFPHHLMYMHTHTDWPWVWTCDGCHPRNLLGGELSPGNISGPRKGTGNWSTWPATNHTEAFLSMQVATHENTREHLS